MNDYYAGFWLRLVACIIDGIIISVAQWILITPILGLLGLSFAAGLEGGQNMSDAEALGMFATIMATMGTTILISSIASLLYFTIMESSNAQATVGKMALGIKVTDMNGRKLDFGKSLVRNLCKVISAMIFYIGYIMAGFADRKQALHDMIASALVVRKSAVPNNSNVTGNSDILDRPGEF